MQNRTNFDERVAFVRSLNLTEIEAHRLISKYLGERRYDLVNAIEHVLEGGGRCPMVASHGN